MRRIKGFSTYFITRTGRVFSLNPYHKRSKWLKGRKMNKSGHLYIALRKNGKTYNRLLHRLVLETFIGKCPKGMECRHLDGNPKNNHLSNLRWGTRKQQKQDDKKHGINYGVNGEKHPLSKLTEKDVKNIRNLYNAGYKQTMLARMFSVDTSNISCIVRRKTWKSI